MALKATAESHGAVSGAFGLTSTDREYWTACGWYYYDGGAVGSDWIATIANASNNPIAYLFITSGGKVGVYDGGFSSESGGDALPSGEWVYLGLRFQRPGGSGNKTLSVGMWKTGYANWTETNSIANTFASDSAPDKLYLGRDSGGFNACPGRFIYWRVYTGGTDQNSGAYLSAAALDTQRNQATASAAFGNGFRENWKMATNDANLLVGDHGVNLTNNGLSWDAAAPTLGGGSQSVVPHFMQHYLG